jgi:hypothetical protein
MASLDKKRMSKQTNKISQKKLSDYINEDIDFLKLDVEGAELDIIKELTVSEKIGRVNQAIIEYHHHIDPNEDNLSELLKLLEESNFGYQITAFAHPKNRKDNKGLNQDVLVYAYNKSKN